MLALAIAACGSRTGLDPTGSSGARGPVRHLIRGNGFPCDYGMLKTFLTAEGEPRALAYESLSPCLDDFTYGSGLVLTTPRYVAVFRSAHDSELNDFQTTILDALTLTKVRSDGELMADHGCVWSPTEAIVGTPDGAAVLDLGTGEMTHLLDRPPGDAVAAGCIADSQWAYICFATHSSASIVPIRVADLQVGDADPSTPGNQPYSLPFPPGQLCKMTLDPERDRLYVQMRDQETLLHSLGIAAFDLGGVPEPRLLLSGERTLTDAVNIVVLPDGALLVLVAKLSSYAYWEWLRVDPAFGEVVSLRKYEVDVRSDNDVLSAFSTLAVPGIGPWVLALAQRGSEEEGDGTADDAYVVEWFNGLTGETGPRLSPRMVPPDGLYTLPRVEEH